MRTTLAKATFETIHKTTGWKIEADAIEGILPFELRARGLQIGTNEQTLVKIDELNLLASPLDLLLGRVTIGYSGCKGVYLQNIDPNTPLFGDAELKGTIGVSLLDGALNSHWTITNGSERLARLKIDKTEGQWRAFMTEEPDGFVQKLSGLPFQTPYHISAVYDQKLAKGNMQIEAKLEGLDLPAPAPLTLSGAFHFEGDKLKIHDLQGVLLSLPILSHGDVELDMPSLALQGSLTAFSVPLPWAYQTYFSSKVDIQGSLDSPSLNVLLECSHIAAEGHTLDDISIKGSLKPEMSDLTGEWRVFANVDGTAVNAHCLARFGEIIKIEDARIITPFGSFYGDGGYDNGLTLHLEGDVSDLGALPGFKEGQIEGTVWVKIDVSPSSEECLLLGSGIRYGEWFFKKVTYQQQTSGFFDGHYSLLAQDVDWKSIHWDDFSFATTLSESRETWPFTFLATGPKEDQIEVNASGQWQTSGGETFVHLGRLGGSLFAHSFELTQPANFFVAEELFRTTLLSLSLADGGGTCEGKFESGELNCVLDAKKLPIDLMNHFLPKSLGIDGSVSLFLRLTGPLHDLQGSAVLQGADLLIYDESLAKIPLSQGKIDAILAENELTFEGQLENEETPFYVKGVLPFSASMHPARFTIPPDQPIRAHLETAGEVSPFLKLFVTDTTNVEGQIDVGIEIGGTLNRPIVEGTAKLTKGVFESLNTGVVVKDIECFWVGNDKKWILESFTGNDGEDGSLSGQGFFTLDEEGNTPFSFSVDLTSAVMVRLDSADMATTGTVSVTGDRNGCGISGQLTVDRVNIQIPEQIPVQMKTVQVTYINDPEETEESGPRRSKDPWPVALDLDFTVPNGFYVTSRGLESEWRGDFSFTGTTLAPKVHGTLQLMTGEYSFNGKSFTSTQGSVHFAGDPGTKTTLYVVGEQQIDTMKVQAILKGDLSDPSLAFRSNPPMSEKEILSWILFGHGIDEITPFQKAQLSESVFTLSSGENEDIISQLRRDMGIDRLDISRCETEERNELSLRIGKYISRGIYVSLSKSINAEANQVAIEANVTRHLKVQAEVGDNAEGKMSLKWARDY